MGDRTMPPPPPRGPVNPRKKSTVKPGFSLMDWNTLKNRATNLAGLDERGMRGITKEEVRRHKSEHDCWTIFRGRVYNITPYLHYHPGTVAEIMKGAGKDCTSLFHKYHPWVNFESLVGNLCIGSLVTEDDGQKDKEATVEGETQAADSTEKEAGEDEEDAEVPSVEVERTVEGLEKVAAAGLDELARQDSVDT